MTALRTEVARLVGKAFGSCVRYCCLTGSAVAGTDRPESDIDLLVVVRDQAPRDEVIAAVGRFLPGYAELHRRHGRVMDLEWPGEYLYERDLRAALDGLVFCGIGADGTPRLCPPGRGVTG